MFSHFLPYHTWSLFIFITGILNNLCIGQTQTCDQILQNARDLYQMGKIEQITESMFIDCFTNADLTPQYKVEAHKYIILSNIYRNQPDQAMDYAKELLGIDPDYRLDEESEPEEYVLLFKTLRRYPVFSLGVNFGLNASLQDSYNNFSVDNDSRTENFPSRVGGQVGVALSYNLTRDLQLLTGVNYQGIGFIVENPLFDYTNLVYDEQLTFLTFPLSFEVDFGKDQEYLYDLKVKKKKIYGFFNLGGEVRYLVDSQAHLERDDDLGRFVDSSPESVKDLREQLTFAAFAGVGFKYNIPRGFLKLQARFTYGINNMVDSKQRYSNPAFIYEGGYLDNDFRLHAVSLSVGYYRSIYNPK